MNCLVHMRNSPFLERISELRSRCLCARLEFLFSMDIPQSFHLSVERGWNRSPDILEYIPAHPRNKVCLFLFQIHSIIQTGLNIPGAPHSILSFRAPLPSLSSVFPFLQLSPRRGNMQAEERRAGPSAPGAQLGGP